MTIKIHKNKSKLKQVLLERGRLGDFLDFRYVGEGLDEKLYTYEEISGSDWAAYPCNVYTLIQKTHFRFFKTTCVKETSLDVFEIEADAEKWLAKVSAY